MKNGKFEVDDIIAGKENPSVPYGITNREMTRAKVFKVEEGRMAVKILDHTDSRYIGRKFDVVNDPATFQLAGIPGDDYPDSAVLVIKRIGPELTADLSADGKLAQARATCSPRDSFSIHAGVSLLLERLGFPKPEEDKSEHEETAEPRPYKPEVGDLVRITCLPNDYNGGLRVGDLAPIVAFSKSVHGDLYVSCPEKSCFFGDAADRPITGNFMYLSTWEYELIERQPGRW